LSDIEFYAAAQDPDNKNKINGYVRSKFLQRNGAYVVDPMLGASQRAYLYSDASGRNKTPGEVANPNNYIVVPHNYSEADAKAFASRLADTLKRGGVAPLMAQMTSAFWPGGSEELQRNPRWGIPPNSFVPAFISAASDHFGYVTGAAGLPRELADYGGGAHNLYSLARGKVSDWINGTDRSNSIDVSHHGLSKVNAANIAQGYAAGAASRKLPSPFNSYGYGDQPGYQPGAIGDGNGISPVSEAISRIDPDEPAPPAWPPGQEAPVRYLASRLRW
jgi:hypothetical protein